MTIMYTDSLFLTVDNVQQIASGLVFSRTGKGKRGASVQSTSHSLANKNDNAQISATHSSDTYN